MEYRASIPPGLPHPNPTISYWQDPPSSLSTHRTTSTLPPSVSIVIIGSGITGTTIAHTLLSQPSPPSTLLLEARTACSGATGRNGGHTRCASYRSFLSNLRSLGEEEAAKIVRFEYGCMKAVHAFARENDFECDSWEGDTVNIIYDERNWKSTNETIREMKRVLGEDDPAAGYTLWGPEAVERRFLARGAIGALSFNAGSISAYKFVIGILKKALEKGLNFQAETPALKIERATDGEFGWMIETSRGNVKAEKVVLATNGYTAHLCPALQGVIVPLRGHVTAQKPGGGMPQSGLSSTYCFVYADGYEYMISRPQGSKYAGDIIIGGGLTKAAEEGLREYGTTDDTTTDPNIIKHLRNSTVEYFGSNWGNDHPDGRMRTAWSGIMGYSADGFPLVGQIPEEQGLYVAASFQGSGMVMCFWSAMALVELLTGRDSHELDQWFPKAFRITKDRMGHRFRGRLHTKMPQCTKTKIQT